MKRLMLAGLLFASMAVAQDAPYVWNDHPDGIPIRQGYHIEWQKSTCPGNDGELIVAWSDTRNQLRDLFAQKMDQDGNMLWGENGLVVSDAYSRQEDPISESDRSGGAFIAWVDFRADSAGNVRAQHIDTDGNMLLDPEGLALCTQSNVQISLNSAYDGNGGAYIAWNDSRTGDVDIYITRITADGTIAAGFETDGNPLVTATGEQVSYSMVPDGSGGVWVGWTDKRVQNDHNIYIQHLQSDGTETLETNGRLLCGADNIQSSPKLAADGQGGVFVSWYDKRSDFAGDIYVQHMDAAGNVSYTENGVPVAAIANNQEINNRIVSSDAGYAILMWQDNRNDPTNTIGDIYAQKLSTSAVDLWGEGGVPVCTAPEEQNEARMTSDGNGGAFISWTDFRSGGTYGYEDIYSQHINSEGDALWGDDGNGQPACTEIAGQYAPSTRSDGNGGTFVVWGDLRYGSIGIFANSLDSDGESRLGEVNGAEIEWGIDGNAKNLVMVSAPGNQAIFIWEDKRFLQSVIVAQKVDADGNVLWTPNGNTLHEDFDEREQREPMAIEDGDGGAFVSFIWGPNLSTAALVTRLGSDGNTAWDDPVSVTAEYNVHPTDYQKDLFICSDNQDGVIAAWSDHNEDIDLFFTKIFVQRIDPDGERLWGDAGIQLSFTNDMSENFVQDLIPDGNGGAYILWQYGPWSMFDLRLQHVDNTGTVVAGWPTDGLTICNADDDQFKGSLAPVMTAGEISGVYAVWDDPRVEENAADLYGQKIGADGTIVWEDNGVLLVTGPFDQEHMKVRTDDEGGFFLMWQDYRTGTDYNIFMQRFDDTGAPLWDEGLTEVCMADNDQSGADFEVVQTDAGLHLVGAWADLRLNNYYDLYGQELAADGSHIWYWGVNGASINDYYHQQKEPAIVDDGEAGAFVGWIDMRSSGKEDLQNIYAQRVNIEISEGVGTDGTTPDGFLLVRNFPNPFNPVTRVELQTGMSVPQADVQVFNLLGEPVATLYQGDLQAGQHQFSWDASGQASGVYLVRVTAHRLEQTHKMLLLK